MLTFADIARYEWTADMRDICASIEEYQTELEHSYSNEAALLKILDFFGRIFNSLKTSLTKFYKSVKRGELKKYVEDHAATVARIDSLNIDHDAFGIEIDVPSGMTASHTEAIKFLTDVFTRLDLKATLTSIKYILKTFNIQLQRNEDVTVQVGGFAAAMNSKKAFVEQSIQKMSDLFSGGTKTTKAFKSEFKSVGEFVQGKREIISTERYLEQVSGISKLTDELTAIIANIESKKDRTVIASAAQSLSESAHTLAKAIDLFGMGIMNLMSLSHNYTLIYNKIAARVIVEGCLKASFLFLCTKKAGPKSNLIFMD